MAQDQDRGLIKDFGTANRILVDEDSRTDEGLISVSNGDQTIRGSVMMQFMAIVG